MYYFIDRNNSRKVKINLKIIKFYLSVFYFENIYSKYLQLHSLDIIFSFKCSFSQNRQEESCPTI